MEKCKLPLLPWLVHSSAHSSPPAPPGPLCCARPSGRDHINRCTSRARANWQTCARRQHDLCNVGTALPRWHPGSDFPAVRIPEPADALDPSVDPAGPSTRWRDQIQRARLWRSTECWNFSRGPAEWLHGPRPPAGVQARGPHQPSAGETEGHGGRQWRSVGAADVL